MAFFSLLKKCYVSYCVLNKLFTFAVRVILRATEVSFAAESFLSLTTVAYSRFLTRVSVYYNLTSFTLRGFGIFGTKVMVVQLPSDSVVIPQLQDLA